MCVHVSETTVANLVREGVPVEEYVVPCGTKHIKGKGPMRCVHHALRSARIILFPHCRRSVICHETRSE